MPNGDSRSVLIMMRSLEVELRSWDGVARVIGVVEVVI